MTSMPLKALANVVMLLVVMAFAFACLGPTGPAPAAGGKVDVPGGSYVNITPDQLAAMLQAKDFVMVNAHIPYEGEIDRTDLFIPYNEVSGNLGKLPQDKGSRIVVYCRTGSMSAIAAKTMVEAGYTNILNLDGGMVGWKSRGFEILDRSR